MNCKYSNENNNIISAKGIKPYLKNKLLADSIIIYDTVESTNDIAKNMALNNPLHGTVIISENQTKGKGRYGKSFYSPNGLGIYMSIILSGTALVSDSVLSTTSAAVATCKAIKNVTGLSPKIKWVNDIFLDDKKVCGILTEVVTGFETPYVKSIITGIGINFKEDNSGFPEHLKNIATSLFKKEEIKITRNMLIAEIINNIMEIFDDIKSPNIMKEYKNLSFILGKDIKILKNKKEYCAKAIDIDNLGRLIVEHSGGFIEKLNSGEVSILKL